MPWYEIGVEFGKVAVAFGLVGLVMYIFLNIFSPLD